MEWINGTESGRSDRPEMVDVADGDWRQAWCGVIRASDRRWTLLHVDLDAVVGRAQERQQTHSHYAQP